MKADRAARARSDDEAGAQIIGALILFGIFVTVIAILNVTAVPAAGLASEQEHYEQTLSALNGLQSEAETAGLTSNIGATVARSIDLAPARTIGQDFFSFFLATPARASGELTFEPEYGNLSVVHYKSGDPDPFYDIGGTNAYFPVGRILFDPHPVFRDEGVIQVENGAVIVSEGGTESMRFDPPISVDVKGTTTVVTVKSRVLNGSASSIGGIAPVRAMLTTEAATLASPANNNAHNATMRINTTFGGAWKEYFARISTSAGLASGTQYYVGLDEGQDGALDRVTWMINGTSTGNDVRLTTGLAVYHFGLS